MHPWGGGGQLLHVYGGNARSSPQQLWFGLQPQTIAPVTDRPSGSGSAVTWQPLGRKEEEEEHPGVREDPPDSRNGFLFTSQA